VTCDTDQVIIRAPELHSVSIAAFFDRLSMPVRSFICDVLTSLRPRAAAELRLVDEQLTLARNATWTNIFVLPLAAMLVSLANAHWVSTTRLIAWPLLMTVVAVACDLYYRYLLRQSDHSARDIGVRARAFARLTLLQAIVWCSAGFVLWAPGNAENHALLILVIACTVSGWSSMGAFHLGTGAAPMPIYLVSLAAMSLMQDSTNEWTLAGLCISFWFLMRTLLMSNYRTRERMIRLEQERGGLIDNLNSAKHESDAARERAEIASRAKSAFLANMSHELRTPLNAILGFSEIINTRAMGPTVSDQYADYAGHIHGSGQHLLSLINDILDLAKIEAGRIDLRESDVDVSALMNDIVLMFSPKAQSGGIILCVNTDRDFPAVLGDERALRQILVNLMSNAIKYTPPAGRITASPHLPTCFRTARSHSVSTILASESRPKITRRSLRVLGRAGTMRSSPTRARVLVFPSYAAWPKRMAAA
jgi:two-component system cell cycle sensor histidine kinase PleC